MLNIISFGGGTQSNAMLVAVAMGKLPKPDGVVICDTGFEHSAVWRYWDKYSKPLCDELGIDAFRVARADTTLTRNRISPIMKYGDNVAIQIPAFTSLPKENGGGDVGKLRNFCSHNWKREVFRHFVNRHWGRQKRIYQWIGFSIDEQKRAIRMKIDLQGKWQNKYPLLELRWRREHGIRAVQEFGWPEPPRSACYICPFHNNREWRYLRDNYPSEFAKAQKVERYLQANDPMKDEYVITLHRSGKNLADAPIDDDTSQGELFGCESGHCFL